MQVKPGKIIGISVLVCNNSCIKCEKLHSLITFEQFSCDIYFCAEILIGSRALI